MLINKSEGDGNLVVKELFNPDSSLSHTVTQDDNGDYCFGNDRFIDLAHMASLAAHEHVQVHKADHQNLDELKAALKAEMMGGPKAYIFEDQTPEYFGVSPSALLHIIEEMDRGRGDAALKQVLKAPRLAKFDSGQPVLSPVQRMNRLISPSESELKLNGSLPLAIQPKPQNELIPLTLSRNSRRTGQSLADALNENLSPALSKVDPKMVLKTAERLATIEKVVGSIQPDLGKLTEAVSFSQEKQIATFMGSIERTIAAAAAGLKSIVGIEITDYSGRHLSETNLSQASELRIMNGKQDKTSKAISGLQKRSDLSHSDRTDERLRIHRERPAADGEVTVDVKPFTAQSRVANFAANSASLGDQQGHVEHHVTDSGAYASATGPAVCASSATVVESNFRSDGIKVTFSVRK